MDRRFLAYYERELKHLRGTAAEFARAYPKVAGRLGLDASASADPYVERIVEAFAFLTARIQHKLGAAQGEFTSHMLELLYPSYLAPTPSMAVMELVPNVRQSTSPSGVVVPRGSALRSPLGDEQTACEYRTAHPVTLWPIELESADYRTNLSELTDVEHLGMPQVKAALRLVLRTGAGMTFDQFELDALPLFCRSGGETAVRLYEQLLSANIGMVVQSAERPLAFMSARRKPSIAPLGFDEEHALLPTSNRTFDGYRLLQEFFAFPERFLFADVCNLRPLLSEARSTRIELLLLFDRAEPQLDGVISERDVSLFCTPAINLFPRTSDRVPLDEHDFDYHVVPDRARPLDFEVHSITRVAGCGANGDEICPFLPMYAPVWNEKGERGHARYAVRRDPRPLKPGRRPRERDGSTSYLPSEVFLSLVDGQSGSFRRGIRQLSVDTLCTNRALPLHLSLSRGELRFSEQSNGSIVSVRCVAGPTAPRTSPAFGDLSWAFLSHLSLDFLTLIRREGEGALALRELLGLYTSFAERTSQVLIAGIVDVQTQGVVRALPRRDGPLTFGRGIEVAVTCNEEALEGTGVFLLGSVLARFFTKYGSINSFVETVVRTQQRGEVMRCRPEPGRRSTL